MVVDFVLWAALAPAAISLTVLLLGTVRRPHSATRRWLPAVAVALPYAVSQWAMPGAPGPASADIARLLIYFAIAGAALGTLECIVEFPFWARLALRTVVSSIAAWLLLGPRLSVEWALMEGIAATAVVSLAFLVTWTAIYAMATVGSGVGLLTVVFLLVLGSFATLIMSGTASTAQLSAILAAVIGAHGLFALRRPAIGWWRSAAPVISLILVSQWTIGLHYASMHPNTFALLVGAAVAPLLTQLSVVRRARKPALLALRLAVVLVPLGLAAASAARSYFAETSTAAPAETASSDSEYGY